MSDEQFVLSNDATCNLYNRLAAAEANLIATKKLYETLQGVAKPESEYLFNFYGDAGDRGAKQIALVERLIEDNPHVVLAAGDNTYTNPGDCDTITADHIAFDKFIQECRLYETQGNHDADVDPIAACAYDLFAYWPGNRRYFNKYFENTGVELFVINSGGNSIGALTEPDGNKFGSIQHQWFVNSILSSTAKWKIVMYHIPHFSQQSGAVSGAQYYPWMDWDWEQYGVDLIINGHNHMNVHHRHKGVNYVQISAPVRDVRLTRSSSLVPYHESDVVPELIYKDNRCGTYLGCPSYGRLKITDTALTVEFVDIETGEPYYCFGITNCNEPNEKCLLPDDYCSAGLCP